MRIAVIGAGAWGTALACVAARNGRPVRIWGRNQASCDEISGQRTHSRYLPSVKLPAKIEATTNMDRALSGATIVLLVVPVQSTKEVSELVFEHLIDDVPIVCCSKGIDIRTQLTPSQTIEAAKPASRVAVLSGPSFAADVALGLPTAVTLASNDIDFSLRLAKQLSGQRFRIYASDDMLGVELSGALKNVVALAVGACRGLGLGASAEAAIIARGFREVSEIVTALGGRRQTLLGLSGLGDLALTCSSELSRNLQFGMALGRGHDTSGLRLAEGAKTVGVAARIVRKLGLECAVIEMIDKVVKGELTAEDSVDLLLARPLKPE